MNAAQNLSDFNFIENENIKVCNFSDILMEYDFRGSHMLQKKIGIKHENVT